ncbi:hypothetical protein K2173_017851 [Erythroxylum novogranatense]|uniref:Activator of Hsp90 ATPase AHSA1-like N-terminal domain-containing protein n=1 Tax=Erythroxylum novogranatense TaxID=1862640 RepID=A0AAV8SML7_9ROSI|nr:hypothetical protein K2173_017851 [Erythroxylum novogranatense]
MQRRFRKNLQRVFLPIVRSLVSQVSSSILGKRRKKLFGVGVRLISKNSMENERGEKEKAAASSATTASSYTYWVRETTADAVPLPPPKKLSPQHPPSSQPPTLGSVWNGAGTWEEKNLNSWATQRIKELLVSVGSLEFPGGRAEVTEAKCSGDAFLVTVRNKKRANYTFELTIKIKGEWILKEEREVIKCYIDIPEFSFGELDDLQMDVRLSDDKDLLQQDKVRIRQDLKLFLKPIREKLVQFERELIER